MNYRLYDPSKSMKDLGANSLDMVEVVSCAMRELKVKVPRSELTRLTNVDGLVDRSFTSTAARRFSTARCASSTSADVTASERDTRRAG